MIGRDAKWAIRRKHKVTGAVFYLSPNMRRWVPVLNHEKNGVRYGRFTFSEADTFIFTDERQNPDFEYSRPLHENVK